MMFAQANSEHCRHKIFNADFTIDGERQPQSMFAMIRHTERLHPPGSVVAYSDNAGVMEGGEVQHWGPQGFSDGATYPRPARRPACADEGRDPQPPHGDLTLSRCRHRGRR
jgi:hypothetical protein